MRIRKVPILLLAILAALVVVAIGSEGQTPPPASGDWEIYDDTSFSSTQLDVNGDILVYYGASLTLDDVDLNMVAGLSPFIRTDSGGILTWDGGNLTHTTDYPPRLFLTYNCSINGVTFGNLYGISITETGVSVTNCTFGGTDGWGISISGTFINRVNEPITIAHNTFNNLARNPVWAYIRLTVNETFRLVLVENVFNGVDLTDAINVTLNAPSAHLVVDGNRVRNGNLGGITLNLVVPDLYLRMNANEVSDVSTDGIRIEIEAEEMEFPGMTDTLVERAGHVGLSISSVGSKIDGLVLSNLTNLDAGETALSLVGADRVTLTDSRIETDGMHFQVAHGTLDIYTSIFRRGSGQVLDGESRITSWRWLDMTCVWVGGHPISNQRVDVLDSSDALLLTGFTGRDGHWKNVTYSDWEKTEDQSRTIWQLRPVLVHPHGRITDGALPTDTDHKVTISFEDPSPPVIRVKAPAGDVWQNTTSLSINGSCSDPHSGVARVQFSLDPNPEWDSKVWTDATGTDEWHVETLRLSEGEYTLCVRAYDRSGLTMGNHSTVAVGRVVIDLTPPVIAVTSPDTHDQPVVVNSTTVDISGWVSEEVSAITIQRTTVPVAGNIFQLEAMVSEGLNEVVITATDLSGNTARYTLEVLRDSTSPVITITAPAEGAILNVTSVLVAGLVDDMLPMDHVVVNGVTVTLSDGAFQVLLRGLDEGPGSVDVTANDLVGNTATLSVDVIIDSLPPALKLVSPSDGLLTRQATVQLEGTSEAGAHITVRDTPVTLVGTTFSHNVTLVEGRNLIEVSSMDLAGNRNSTLLVVVRDSVAPALELFGLVNGTIKADGLVAYINGRTEPGAFLFIMVGDSSRQVHTFADGSFVHTLTVIENETQVILRAEDAAGNTAFGELRVLRGQVVEPATTPPPAPVDPVVTATVVTTSVLVMVGVAMSFEFTKYGLVLMVLPLYARIKKHEVLDNKTRLAIHGLVVENPGMHYNEIIREFDLTNGVAAYHLDVLEREGFIRSVRDGTLRRFYSSATKVPGGHKATPDQTREHILELVSTNPGINQKAIVDELGIGRTLAGYHLKTLIDEGYIEAHKEGRFTVYSRTRKRWFRLN